MCKETFTKRLLGLYNLNYTDHLRICNIESLELRRIRSDMFLVYKLLHSFVTCNLSEFITVSSNMHNTKGASDFKKIYADLMIHLKHFVIKCVNSWNL